MARVLVAASPDIANQAWIEKCLSSVLLASGPQILQFGDNHALSSALRGLGFTAETIVKGSGAQRRSEVRRALGATDHLLLMWDGRSLTQLLFEARLKGHPTKLFAIEVATVVNKDRGDEFDVYIGRGTPWGNPYPVGKLEGQYEREEAIDLYRRHFEQNIVGDPGMFKGLLGLRGLRLACHCKPLACHGDVIAAYVNSLEPEELDRAFKPHG